MSRFFLADYRANERVKVKVSMLQKSLSWILDLVQLLPNYRLYVAVLGSSHLMSPPAYPNACHADERTQHLAATICLGSSNQNDMHLQLYLCNCVYSQYEINNLMDIVNE